jgi:large subunit ribosomal protein L28
MAKVCDICGKHASVGHTISHAHNATLRKWQPNLRQVRALVDGRVKRIKVCAKCLKAGKVLKAPHKTRVKSAAEKVLTPAIETPVTVASAVEMTSAV